jgi:alpha/beta hydrolase fold
MRRTTTVALAAGAAGAWVAAARDAGLFLHGHPTAAVPGEPTLDAWSQRKRYLDVGTRTVAYVEEGYGDPVLLLHGCPFHALEWQQVIPRLAGHYRVLAPDLPGLGDTPVRLDDDYRLPQIAQTIVGLLDTLGIDAAHVGRPRRRHRPAAAGPPRRPVPLAGAHQRRSLRLLAQPARTQVPSARGQPAHQPAVQAGPPRSRAPS